MKDDFCTDEEGTIFDNNHHFLHFGENCQRTVVEGEEYDDYEGL